MGVGHLRSASCWERKADLRGRKQVDEEEEGPSRGAVRWAQGKSRLYESLMGRPGVWAHGAQRPLTVEGKEKRGTAPFSEDEPGLVYTG